MDVDEGSDIYLCWIGQHGHLLEYCAYVINTKNRVLAHILVIHTSCANYRQGWGRGGGVVGWS